jgi:hypothetical protein
MNKQIIEDTISRNRKFQEQRNIKVKRLKELRAPLEIIAYEEMVAGMSIAEYEIHLDQQEKKNAAINAEYAKNNPVQKHIVDEIYNRVEKLEFDFFTYISDTHFLMSVHPLEFMSQEDYDHNLYQTFLDHAQELYHGKYLNEYNAVEKLKGSGSQE